MDLAKVQSLLQQALAELQSTPPAQPPPTPPSVILTADAFDRALSSATADATIVCDPTLVYQGPLKITVPVTIQTAASIAPGRMTADQQLPRFLGGTSIQSDGVMLLGLELRHTSALADICTISGAHVWLERVRVLGDPTNGAKRGIAANGGDMTIARCYIDDCFGPYPSPTGNDQQAICAWDMIAPGLTIQDCFLRAGSETIMIGGADSASDARMPSHISIISNTITKRATWQQQAVSVKNVLELKACRDVQIAFNDISQSWGGHGQDGYLLMLTVRNQGGKAPWSTIQDVHIGKNTFRAGAAAVNILAADNNHPSGTLTNVTIDSNTFMDMDAQQYTGSQKMIQIAGGPQQLAITNNGFVGRNLTSAVYFAGGPKATDLQITGNTWPKTKYGVFGTNVAVGQAWNTYVATGTLANNTETP
jgi:hypothetical protein